MEEKDNNLSESDKHKMKWLYLASGIILCVGALSSWITIPYEYFVLLRWVICISALVAIVHFFEERVLFLTISFTIILVLFNPLLPFSLNKQDWIMIDLISALIFFAGAWLAKQSNVDAGRWENLK